MNTDIKIKIRNLTFAYQPQPVLHDISADFLEKRITAITGPSGSGKSTLLVTLNRLWETTEGAALQGSIEIKLRDQFHDIYRPDCSVNQLRRQVGMVFQTPNPLPFSIYKNVAFPLKLTGGHSTSTIREKVTEVLKLVGLWSQVEQRLENSALELSGGQQQRLCIARAMILNPEVLLLDEPTSSLDHQAVATIEKLLLKLKERCTLLMVSHDCLQVERIADQIIELEEGRIVASSL